MGSGERLGARAMSAGSQHTSITGHSKARSSLKHGVALERESTK